MAKVGKKTGGGGQSGSRNGRGGPAPKRKAPREEGKSASPEGALADARGLRDEIGAARRELGAALAALRAEVAAATDEVSRSRAAVRALRDEAAARHTEEAPEPRPRPAQELDAGADRSPRPEHPNRLGVTVASEVVVTEIAPDTPAAGADLHRGDIVAEVNGRPIHSGDDLVELVEEMPKGGDVTFHVRRGGTPLIRTLKLDPATDDESKPRFGVTVALGTVIEEVLDGSPAATAGLHPGDVIERANGEPVQLGDHLHALVHALPDGADLPLVVTRGGGSLEFVARLGPA